LPNNTTIAEFSDRPFKDSIKTLINNFTYICKIQIDDFIYNTYPICEKQAKLYYDLTEIVELENFGNTCYYMNKDDVNWVVKTLEPNNFGYSFWYNNFNDIYNVKFSKRKLRRELGRNKTRNKRNA
jgi:hypothetical protein